MANPTTPVAGDTLSPEQKANRELATSLVDARRILAKSIKEAEAKLVASKDQAIKELSKMTTTDQVIARLRLLAAVVEQSDKDIAALRHAQRLISQRLEQLEKSGPDDLLAVCVERQKELTEELTNSKSDQKPLEEQLKFLNEEIRELMPYGYGKTAMPRKPTKSKPAAKPVAATGAAGAGSGKP